MTDLRWIMSSARVHRRQDILAMASRLVGASVRSEFDAVHAPMCEVDVVLIAGAPWLKEGLERDFYKDESGYKKIGGGANSPSMTYFFRSTPNLIHYLKRQSLYVPRGARDLPREGMACFFDWDDRGRFNFTPDRAGIISKVEEGRISEVIIALPVDAQDKLAGFVVERISIRSADLFDTALIGYSDLP